jgi:glycosyltransferase involved in cell wall biosynthesis
MSDDASGPDDVTAGTGRIQGGVHDLDPLSMGPSRRSRNDATAWLHPYLSFSASTPDSVTRPEKTALWCDFIPGEAAQEHGRQLVKGWLGRATAGGPFLRIAQVAPLFESVPPKFYGGTERIVSYLTEDLVRRGHEVTLFASGDSVTRARLRAVSTQSLRLDSSCKDQLSHHILMLEQVAREASHFDVIHYHVDYLHFPTSRRLHQKNVTTLHGRLDFPDFVPLYHEYREMPLVSISEAQRTPLWWANWQATVYHGIPRGLYSFHDRPGTYLAFLGRISREKGIECAVETARRTGLPLKIAAKIGAGADQDYFDKVIHPMIKGPGIEFLGEIRQEEKGAFLGNAMALLFPIDWPEPFGLVMIEALACGTPVIAVPKGSVPEILEEGVTGYLGNSVEDMVRAVGRIGEIDRRRCRRAFEQRFTDDRMGREYEAVYRRVMEGNGSWRR